MVLEPGIVVSDETIRPRCRKFGARSSGEILHGAFDAKQPSPNDVWRLDEVVISIAGKKLWLWRAVDQHGYVLDEVVQNRLMR